jgi:hypothetical protein
MSIPVIAIALQVNSWAETYLLEQLIETVLIDQATLTSLSLPKAPSATTQHQPLAPRFEVSYFGNGRQSLAGHLGCSCLTGPNQPFHPDQSVLELGLELEFENIEEIWLNLPSS